MASLQQQQQQPRKSLYPQIDDDPIPAATNTAASNTAASTSSSLYPKVEMNELVENLFPATALDEPPVEETLLRVPGAVIHLIDPSSSVELASGDFSIALLKQGTSVLAALARVSDAVQWPLARDEPAVRLDASHYFFSLRVPDDPSVILNYGLTFASKGQEELLRELDVVLQTYSAFSVQEVPTVAGGEALDVSVARGTAPEEAIAERKDAMEREASAYWTTLAPNVEEYSGLVARGIAKGSGKLVKGILWCGEVTVERLRWGNEFLKGRMDRSEKDAEVSPETLRRIQRVKRMTKMSEKVANGVLSGVVKVSGVVTSSVVNSKVGQKFFGLLPGEIVLATLDGFAKICDAVEEAGKNVLSTSSDVTTELVSHRYGEKAAEATHESLGAAGHAFGTAWAVFKIRKALNPKSSMKPSSLVKAAFVNAKK